jgi:hypothetical protein
MDSAQWPQQDLADDAWQLEYWLDTMVALPVRAPAPAQPTRPSTSGAR